MSTVIKYAWLSVATAVVTILLKAGAYFLTGSVGLLSDAAESGVNLVAAVVALIALTVATRPADEEHQFGHSKAEYFSSAVEGAMIFAAAAFIIWTAIMRLLHPQPIEQLGIGMGISLLASVFNGAVGLLLIRAGRKHRSISLEADGKHLFTDVWTSVGVVAALLLVWLTGWEVLDPIIAIAVGINIMFVGFSLIRESMGGLMDLTLPDEDNQIIDEILDRRRVAGEVDFHEVRTRQSGRMRFVEFHMLVPGWWSVTRAHDLVDAIEQEIKDALDNTHTSSHIEPLEDERAYDDVEL